MDDDTDDGLPPSNDVEEDNYYAFLNISVDVSDLGLYFFH